MSWTRSWTWATRTAASPTVTHLCWRTSGVEGRRPDHRCRSDRQWCSTALRCPTSPAGSRRPEGATSEKVGDPAQRHATGGTRRPLRGAEATTQGRLGRFEPARTCRRQVGSGSRPTRGAPPAPRPARPAVRSRVATHGGGRRLADVGSGSAARGGGRRLADVGSGSAARGGDRRLGVVGSDRGGARDHVAGVVAPSRGVVGRRPRPVGATPSPDALGSRPEREGAPPPR